MKDGVSFELSADRWFIWNIKAYSAWNSLKKSSDPVYCLLGPREVFWTPDKKTFVHND